MKGLLFIILILTCHHTSFSQSFRKYQIADSGCSAYFYCDPGVFDISYSPDSSVVYTAECQDDRTTYGIILVGLATSITEAQVAEDVLVSYLDYLKVTLEITSSAGYGYGHRLQESDDTRGIVDYWYDAELDNWKVKGWTDGRFIAVLFAYTSDDIAEEAVNLFLDGFRFPGME